MGGSAFLKFAILTGLLCVFSLIFLTFPSISCISSIKTEISVDTENLGTIITKGSVKVIVITNGQESRGSGVLITKHLIFTAYHVIRYADEVYLEMPNLDRIKCTIEIRGDLELADYAVLKTEEELSLSPVEIDYSAVFQAGKRVYIAGFPLGRSLHFSEGLLGSVEDGFYKSSAPILFGQSGGGVFDTEGRLIGILSRMGVLNRAFQSPLPVFHISYFVPIDIIILDLISKDSLDLLPEPK